MIQASERYSTAMLEMLVRWNSVPPPAQSFVEIVIPRNVLINAEHSEFGQLKVGAEIPVRWDERLFR